MTELLNSVLPAILLTIVMLGLVVVSRFVFGAVGRLEGYNLTYEMVKNDNPAIGIRYALFTLAVVVSFLGMLHPSGISFREDLNNIAYYGFLSVVFLMISRWVNDYAILYAFSNNKEVVKEKNQAVALVEGSTYLATAFIMKGALAGWEGGFWVSTIWFGIGQLFLVVLAFVYRKLVNGVFEALDNHNVACGLSLGGFLLAGGIALGAAISGPFAGWKTDLMAVGIYILGWAVMMFLTHLVTDWLILPSARTRDEVMKDRNIAAGAIEGAMFMIVTLFYVYVA